VDAPAISATGAAATLVAGLSIQRFRDNIKTVASFGDRLQGSTKFDNASAWLDQTLSGIGYTVEHHSFTYQGGRRINTFVTKVGSKFPDRMYIVGGHLDGRGNGGGADDDGSGVSLVLEVARAFAAPTVQTDVSIRFAFWCNEETGMDGSRAYVSDRAALQGVENPPGSHKFPEPRWLGMIQHDMMLFDHGMPRADGSMAKEQRPEADVNIEFQSLAKSAEGAQKLAWAFYAANEAYATDYPAAVGPHMTNTDSTPFMDLVPAISLRENERGREIGAGWDPQWHQPTDVYATYSDADFRLGLNAAQTTLGAIGRLTGATLTR